MMGILRALRLLAFTSDEEDANSRKGNGGAGTQPELCTILAIDDDPEFLQVVRTALKDEGYNVLSTTSGPKGLDMIRYAPSPVRVVVLDYDMPKLNGAETLAFLRRLNPHAKIIAVTGMNASFLQADFREGVDHIFYKPFHMKELLSLIHNMIEAYPALSAKQTV